MNIKLDNYDYANIFTVNEDDDGYYFLNMYNNIILEDDIDPTLYESHYYNEETDDWYSLSARSYGTTKLWWTILIANNITDAFEPIPTGTLIKILKPSVVTEILHQITLSK